MRLGGPVLPWRTAAGWPVSLEDGDIGLRPLRRGDGPEWTRVRERNADWLTPWDGTSPDPSSGPRTYTEMWAGLQRQARSGQAMPFVMTLRESLHRAPRLVGQLTVANIVYGASRSCTIGYWVDGSVAGRGITPTCVALAADHCFDALGLHRVEINICPENAPSLRVVEKLGFRDEGLRPRLLHINGSWRDHRSFALTAEEVPGGVLERYRERSVAAPAGKVVENSLFDTPPE